MKQLGLSLLLLTAVSVASATKLDYDLTVNGERATGSYEFEGQTFDISEEFAGYSFKAHLQTQEDGLEIKNEISKCDHEGHVNVVSKPEVHVAWEQEGVITLADDNNQETIKLIVRAHK
jgi:hypothetical protein